MKKALKTLGLTLLATGLLGSHNINNKELKIDFEIKPISILENNDKFYSNFEKGLELNLTQEYSILGNKEKRQSFYSKFCNQL